MKLQQILEARYEGPLDVFIKKFCRGPYEDDLEDYDYEIVEGLQTWYFRDEVHSPEYNGFAYADENVKHGPYWIMITNVGRLEEEVTSPQRIINTKLFTMQQVNP